MTPPGATERRVLLRRFAVFGLALIFVVGTLTARLFYLQVVRGAAPVLEERRSASTQIVRAARGLIVDRTGQPLVRNVAAFVVRVRPADLPLSRRSAVVTRLSRITSIPAGDINQRIDRRAGARFDAVEIASDVPEDVARLIAEEAQQLPGVTVELEPRRRYLHGPLVAKLVGYTGAITAIEYDHLKGDAYQLDDSIGRAGVEASYEPVLRGTPGQAEVARDSIGRPTGPPRTVRPAEPGRTIELTVDVEMQRKAEHALRWAMELAGLRRGVFIAMDPQTGEILAMATLPTYDNNVFARGITNEEYARLLRDRDRPLINAAISEQFPPGSTYKLVTGAGALADRLITPSTRLETGPYITAGRDRYYEWNRRGWGALDVLEGFAHSSDTFFFQLAGRLGVDRLASWARQFGFGAPTGIDLPGEASGVVPTNEWKERRLGQRVYAGETLQAGIGQGYDAATPLQVLNAYAALANGGRLLRPHVVRRILDAQGREIERVQPDLIRRIAVPPQVLTTMRLAARRVVTIRHTYNLVDLPLVVAGKSGTAEFGTRDAKGRLPFHSWFAAFVPRDPRPTTADPHGLKAVARTDAGLAVLAFMYDSRTKGNVATEVVKYFLQMQYGIREDYRNFDLVKRGNFYQGN